eukprot:90405-Prorocentrum_minimum.AAC.1
MFRCLCFHVADELDYGQGGKLVADKYPFDDKDSFISDPRTSLDLVSERSFRGGPVGGHTPRTPRNPRGWGNLSQAGRKSQAKMMIASRTSLDEYDDYL